MIGTAFDFVGKCVSSIPGMKESKAVDVLAMCADIACPMPTSNATATEMITSG